MGLLGRLAALAGGCGAVRRCLGRPCAASRPPARAAASSPALGQYGEVFRASVAEPEKVWGAAAELIQWSKPWARALERRGPGSDSWFVGGELNICYNAVDRHVENGRGDHAAIIYDSPVTNTKEKITYKELLEQPRLIVTASFGVEPKRKVEYMSLLEGALAMVQNKPEKVLIYRRPNLGHVPLTPGRDLDWEEELAKAQCYKCVSVPSDHPLYILYTSGTTGLPKGVIRPTGGYAVMLNWTMSTIYGLKPGEVWWAASDLGWVVGHSYICYGPLLHGNPTVLYEGKPVGTPDAGAYFRVLAEHEVAAFFTSPTAIRAIRQQDPEAALGKQYSLKRFRMLFVAGEHCDVGTLEWSKKVFKVPVLDHWWQTESGSPITASCVGLGNSTTPPPGQAGKPVPGYNVMILDENKEPVKAKTLGNIVVKLPLPPGAFSGLWENQEAFHKLYFQKFPGYYDTMDAGYMDEDGYLYVLSRADDVINVAGHRISAGAIEECVLRHPAVADCAVVGQEDALKGHVPFALCVLRDDVKAEEKKILEDIVEQVRNNIGPVAAFQKGVFVKQLPKTRSGKIPRSALSALVSGKPYKITPTIEDASVFKDIEEVLKKK
ncbi:acyl-CoA synthetase short-chain family member 3, mitochondrial isoform X3 [Tympanuchus pallidicinctus]|uniref:acyl-CoA synthetase short-chain family member 3, mitochondrial isoform X3 n=1 Tax=Tympanuchus pallidicinctus TaxID=109042 RepID=UPI0022876ECF|nr:acyl-CoA synthetase short-chain family member 3, mitochondrial isoform X3 [Tympanuchus pallidicinctus]